MEKSMSRLPAADEQQTPGLSGVLDEIRSTRGWVSNALRAFGHAPEGLRRFAAMGEYVRFQTGLPDRLRELVIIMVARGCDYAWQHHTEFARKAGVSEPEIAAIGSGQLPQSLSSTEAAALRYVQAFLAFARIDDAEFDGLRHELGPRMITDLTLLAGYFRTLGWVLATYEVDVEAPELLDRYWQGGGRAKLA